MVQVVENLLAKAGDGRDSGSIPGLGRSPGGRNGNPFQYPWLENFMDRGTVGYNRSGLKESDMTEYACKYAWADIESLWSEDCKD